MFQYSFKTLKMGNFCKITLFIIINIKYLLYFITIKLFQ